MKIYSVLVMFFGDARTLSIVAESAADAVEAAGWGFGRILGVALESSGVTL